MTTRPKIVTDVDEPAVAPFDAVLEAWVAWDAACMRRPKYRGERPSPHFANDLCDAVDRLACELDLPVLVIRRAMAAGRRTGRAHDAVLDSIVTDSRAEHRTAA